ncbi:MAG: hypothetical protein AAGG68_02410 [Bacteroidota bacterium]
MKRVLLFVAIMLVDLLVQDHLNKSSNLQVVEATVISVEKVKNIRKGDKPFMYKVNMRYENDFGRSHETSFIARRRPNFQKDAAIAVAHSPSNPSTIRYQKERIYGL